MTIGAKIIAHSRPAWATDIFSDLITMQLIYPRCIHSEFMTHRVFSRNASSSRAVPVSKLIDKVCEDPYVPDFSYNKPGMQAGEMLDSQSNFQAQKEWRSALAEVLNTANALSQMNVHKQWVNRLLEPWSHIEVVVTATEWTNFFILRDHPAAQPEIRQLAIAMKEAGQASIPKILRPGEWHTPYVDRDTVGELNLISAARCARVSYLNHANETPNYAEDLSLANKLLSMGHMSPFEHQAVCWGKNAMPKPGLTHRNRRGIPWSGNFRWWGQHRQIINEA